MPEMSSAYKQIQQHLLNELPIMPLWHDHQVSVTRPNIKDYQLSSDGRYDALLLTRKLAS
jgi:peptide/nickel transport system substrate-binding protein